MNEAHIPDAAVRSVMALARECALSVERDTVRDFYSQVTSTVGSDAFVSPARVVAAMALAGENGDDRIRVLIPAVLGVRVARALRTANEADAAREWEEQAGQNWPGPLQQAGMHAAVTAAEDDSDRACRAAIRAQSGSPRAADVGLEPELTVPFRVYRRASASNVSSDVAHALSAVTANARQI